MDCDFSHDPADLPRLIAACNDADLALGSRYVEGGGIRNWSLFRRFVSRSGCLYARIVLGVPVHDLTGGFKCFDRRVLEAIALADVRAEGYAFQIEMTYRARLLGFDGKWCIHPNQIEWAAEAFVPAQELYEEAERILAAYAEAAEVPAKED